MKDVFFVPSFGNRPKNLVGREDVLRSFDVSLDSVPGSRDRALLILGQRGSGKTVLLLELAEKAGKTGYIVASPTIAANSMKTHILEKLMDAGKEYLPKEIRKISGGSISILGFGGGIEFQDEQGIPSSFQRKIFDICRQINKAGHPVLILVDEVQSNHEELKQLIVAYQEMVGAGIDVAMVLAGLPSSVSSVLNDHVLTFLNRAVKIELPPLKTNDIAAYYTDAFSGLGISVSDRMINDAAEASEGSPYMMQLIGHYVTVYSDEKGKITKEKYLKALRNAREDFINDICRTTLNMLSEKDIEYLYAMSKDKNESRISSVCERLGVSDAYVQTYKRRLIQSGVIKQVRRGVVDFDIPYLKEFLANTPDR